jgi:hypothetical protein
VHSVDGMRVKLRENRLHRWIVVPSDDQRLAWNGSRWVPIDRDGISVSELQSMEFVTVSEAAVYAASIGFEVEHG